MKTLVTVILLSLLSLNLWASDSVTQYKVDKKTVIALAEVINNNINKNDEGVLKALGEIIGQDTAIHEFAKMMVDVCQNPQKYDFPVKGVDKSECRTDLVMSRVQSDFAYSLTDKFRGEVEADQIEGYLNNYLNTYLGKMRAVIEAFNSWM